MPTRDTFLQLIIDTIDRVIAEHSRHLVPFPLAPHQLLVEEYQEAYATIEGEVVYEIGKTLAGDMDQLVSLRGDVDPVLQQKLQEFAFKYNPVRDNLN